MTTPSEPSLVQLWLHGGLDLSEQLQKEPPECPAENVSAHPTPRRDRTLVEQGVHRSLRLYNVLAGLLCVVLSALMLLTAADLPPYGSDTAPTVNEVAQRYVEQGTQETGAVNTVAGMILDYRAFDTLGESFVLFTAMCAVTILLNRSGKRRWLLQPDVVDYASDPIVAPMSRFLIPVILVFGIYILLNGHLSPGGGFSGGAILAAGLMLFAMVWGDAAASAAPDGGAVLPGLLLPGQELLLLYRCQSPALCHLPRHPGPHSVRRADSAPERGGGLRGVLHHVQPLYVLQKGGAMMLKALASNYELVVAILLFVIGFCMLLFDRNLLKKVIGLDIMDSGVFLLLADRGYITGRTVPIIVDGVTSMEHYVNPIPAGLVLTGIVVSVSVSAVMLSLTVRIYQTYRTLDMDKLYMMMSHKKRQKEDGEQ